MSLFLRLFSFTCASAGSTSCCHDLAVTTRCMVEIEETKTSNVLTFSRLTRDRVLVTDNLSTNFNKFLATTKIGFSGRKKRLVFSP